MQETVYDILVYQDIHGNKPFEKWLKTLGAAAALIDIQIERIRQGNPGKVRPVRDGVHEVALNKGPGYRIYFGNISGKIILLLGGGTKRRQQRDIEDAIKAFDDYKRRTRQ